MNKNKLLKQKYALTYYNEIGAGSKSPHHPSFESGVTIGCGYDLKHKSISKVENELSESRIDEDIIKRLLKGVGLSGKEASQFCKDNKDIEITEANQLTLFEVLAHAYEAKAIKDYKKMFGDSAPSYYDLPTDIKALIFDYTYNLGTINKFPKFFKALLSGDRRAAYANYKRYTGGVPLGKRNTDTERVLDNLMFRNYLG